MESGTERVVRICKGRESGVSEVWFCRLLSVKQGVDRYPGDGMIHRL